MYIPVSITYFHVITPTMKGSMRIYTGVREACYYYLSINVTCKYVAVCSRSYFILGTVELYTYLLAATTTSTPSVVFRVTG